MDDKIYTFALKVNKEIRMTVDRYAQYVRCVKCVQKVEFCLLQRFLKKNFRGHFWSICNPRWTGGDTLIRGMF